MFAERKAMIDRFHKLSLTRREKALGISRGSVYPSRTSGHRYQPRPVSDADLRLVLRIDELHLDHPFAESRMMRDLLRQEDIHSGRRHVSTLMRWMGIEALYRKPSTSRRHPRHLVYPYLPRGLAVTRPNQVWVMDITYIPMAKGFVYVTVVMDWHSREVLAWRVSVTMDTAFCVESVEEARERYGVPDIFNTDQESQSTGEAFTSLLNDNGIRIRWTVVEAGRTTCSSSVCARGLS